MSDKPTLLTRATSRDADAYIDLLEDAARWMDARGIEQWRPGSMRAQRDAFAAAQAAGDLYVVRDGEAVVGGVALRSQPDPSWDDRPERSAWYLGKLVVARDRVGGALGERILAEAERIAAARGATWLRLDCVASNESLARYYQRLGYYPRGVARGLSRHDKRLTPLAGVAVGSLDAIDFARWRADSVATLLFVVREREILLIRKLRGHGAGKINGPGGMVETGETPRACAQRELEEEVGVTAIAAKPLVELLFQNTDGSSMLGYAFRADGCRGVAHATAEAVPFWCPLDAVPYDAMWDDDRIWLPYLLGDQAMTGAFLIDGERLVAHRLWRTTRDELAARVARRIK
jgi:8-oxo-dGTP diphosphatase